MIFYRQGRIGKTEMASLNWQGRIDNIFRQGRICKIKLVGLNLQKIYGKAEFTRPNLARSN